MHPRETLPSLRPEVAEYKTLIDVLPPDISGLRGKIRALALHPIKSLGILNVKHARIGRDGLRTEDNHVGDRMAMIVRKVSAVTKSGAEFDCERFSQREEGTLALARPTYDGTSGLSYHAPFMEPLDIEHETLQPRAGEAVRVKMFKKGTDIFEGVYENGDLTEWVRRFLHKNAPGARKYDVD